MALPATAPQRIQAAVIADSRVGIGIDDPTVDESPLGKLRPRLRRRREPRGDLRRVLTGGERVAGPRVRWEKCWRRSAEQVLAHHAVRHVTILPGPRSSSGTGAPFGAIGVLRSPQSGFDYFSP